MASKLNRHKNKIFQPNQSKSNSKFSSRESKLEFYQGKLPHPDIMNKFSDEVRQVILNMAQKEQDNLLERKNKEITLIETRSNANIKIEKRGQILGFSLALIVFIGAIFLFYLGVNGAGFFMIIVEFIAIIAIFIKNNTNND